MPSIFVLCVLLFALFGSLAAKAGSSAHLRIGISQFPSTLHPFFDDMTAKSYVLGMGLRPVTAHDADWKAVCILCTEIPTYANGRARKEILKDGRHGIAATYTIQPQAAWGDGIPDR